jgi:hypothetical protein
MNPLYEDDIENEFQQNIHDIKKQNLALNKYKLNIYYITQVLKPM